MLLSKTAKVKWHGSNKEFYMNKGYEFTKHSNEFEVPIEDLQLKSNSLVEVECDIKSEGCFGVVNKTYNNYNKERKDLIIKGVDCCSNIKCMKVKREMAVEKKYGVKSVLELQEVQDKMKSTNLERYGSEYQFGSEIFMEKTRITVLEKYGVENVFQSEEVKQKIKETLITIYGVDHPSKSAVIIEKIKESNMKKFGVPYSSQNEEVKQKVKQTSLKRYGTEYPMQSEEVKKKQKTNENLTLYLTGTAPCSSQQWYIHSLIGGELNYPVDTIMLDIAFPDEKIYVEYDGGGHDFAVKIGRVTEDEFKKMDMRRELFLKCRGWKIIKIISMKDNLPSDEEILNFITFAKEYLNERSWIYLDVDKGEIKGSKINKTVTFQRMITKMETREIYKQNKSM